MEEEFGVQTINQPQNCTGWREISSAPKDGSVFLAFNPMVGVYSTAYTVRWTGKPEEWDAYRSGSPTYEGFPCGFWSQGLGHFPFGKWDCQPTHWMPNPAPPSSEEQRLSPSAASAGNAGLDDLNPLPPDIKEWIEELRKSAESPDEADDGSWELSDEGRKARDRDRLRLSALRGLVGKAPGVSWHVEAGMRVRPPAPEPFADIKEIVEGLRELRRFLDGSGELDGLSFGERRAPLRPFWWRSRHLGRIDQAASALLSLAGERDEHNRCFPHVAASAEEAQKERNVAIIRADAAESRALKAEAERDEARRERSASEATQKKLFYAAMQGAEAFSTLCEWFGQRESGLPTTNSESVLFARCSQASDYLDASFELLSADEPDPFSALEQRATNAEAARLLAEKQLAEAVKLAELIDTAHEHGDEQAIADAARAFLAQHQSPQSSKGAEDEK